MQETTDLSGNLIDSILAFCKQTKMAESTFGCRAVNDEKFVPGLRNGSGITQEIWKRVAKFISSDESYIVSRKRD